METTAQIIDITERLPVASADETTEVINALTYDAASDAVARWMDVAGRYALLTAEEEVELAKAIEAGLFAQQKLDTDEDMPRLYKRDLMEIARLGGEAKERMICANLRLVISVAKKYRDPGLELIDLISEGNAGLIRAVERFDYRKGEESGRQSYKFSTYAIWWIRQAIARAIDDQGRTIRIPASAWRDLNKLRRAEDELRWKLGRQPTVAELAQRAGVSEERTANLRENLRVVSSIEADSNTGIALKDIIPDDTAVDPEKSAVDIDFRTVLGAGLEEALSSLTNQERTTIRLHYGLEDGREWTLAEIAQREGCTYERIRQLRASALESLRQYNAEQGDYLGEYLAAA